MRTARTARRSIVHKSRCVGRTRFCQRSIGTALVLSLALVSAGPGKAAEAPPKGEAPNKVDVAGWHDVPDLVERLRRGGLVLYIRHATTDKKQKDQRPINLADCAKQRNLSDEGRRESQAIGAAIRTLGIPIGAVLSSPFCRTIETAQLAFGKYEKSDMLYFAIGISTADKSKAEAALRNLLNAAPAAGENRVVISHTANLKDAAGVWPKPEGVAIVFEPRGTEQVYAVARIEPGDWSQIVAQIKK